MNDDIKSKIRTIPNWPKKGIMFRDITTLIKDEKGFRDTCQMLCEHYKDVDIDIIAGIESRGFIFGTALAMLLKKGFVPIRKKGKLPAETVSQEYELEYGVDQIEVHKDAIKKGDRVLVVDDLLATGGTMKAACQLVEKCGGTVVGCAIVIELTDLHGRDKLKGYDFFRLVEFEGE
ncbi:MAG: adenine phosphoribosyltransferase [Candidatus Bathyarchaeota archaeon]|nr:adenine phosphoribosyltransferase [Candidatus Bathyarchaeota archaeon]